MKTLIINSHPDFKNSAHYSIQFQELFLELFQAAFPDETPEILNLYEKEIPRIENGQLLSIWNKQADNQLLTQEEKRLEKISNQLLTQFKNHKRIVLVTPLHNFNVESRMKDYIDNILIARETFKYTEDGSVGLMTDNRKLLMIQASGSIYTNQDRYTALDISHLFIEGIFKEIMGFSNIDNLRIEGTALLNQKAILEKGKKELTTIMTTFYNN